MVSAIRRCLRRLLSSCCSGICGANVATLVFARTAMREAEITVRTALGAGPRRIIASVFSRAFTQIGIGVLAGAVPGTVIMMEGAEDAGGLGTAAGVCGMVGVCAFVVLVALIACAAPLRRALRIEPTQALRADA